MLRNLFHSINVRLIGMYLLIAGLAMAVGLVGYAQINRVGNILTSETTARAETRYLGTKIRLEVFQISALAEDYVQAESADLRARLAAQLADELTVLCEFIRQLSTYPGSDATEGLSAEVVSLLQRYITQAEIVIATHAGGNRSDEQAAAALANFRATHAQLMERLIDLENQQTSALYRSREAARQTVAQALALTITMTLLALAFGILFGSWASSSITRPVHRLVEAAQRLADGELGHRAPVESRSEIGLLARVFNQMASQLQDLVHSLEQRVIELRQASARLELLHSLGQSLSQSLDLEEVAQRALDGICNVVGARHGAVLVSDARGSLRIVADLGYDPALSQSIRRHFVLLPGEGLAGWVADQRQSALVDDVTQDSRWKTVQGLDDWVRSAVSVPLVSRGELVGVLSIYSEQVGFFNESHRRLAESVAAVVAVALANARLYEATRRQLEELSILHAVALVAAEAEDEDSLIERVTQIIGGSLYPDNFGLLLLDKEGSFLRVHPSYRGLTPEVMWRAVPVSGSISGSVVTSGVPYNVHDAASDPHYFSLTGKMRSELCVPLKVGERVVGVINVESSEVGAFTEADERLLTTLAGQLATAIEKVRLFAQVRQRAEELSAALAQLEQLDQLKSEFIQNVSHELRSPLALILGYAELLAGGELGELSEAQKGAAEIIARRIRMVNELVKDITLILLAESRPLEREPVDLGEMAQATVADFRLVADQANLTLDAEIEPGLPPVSGAPLYLRRVLDNLIGNAIKFTPAGGTVTVRAYQRDACLLVEIADTGIGIPAEEHERVFGRFYQVDGSSSRRYGGVGLGLALVKEIVEAHGGTVRLESEVGRGSTFTVILPLGETIDPAVPCADSF